MSFNLHRVAAGVVSAVNPMQTIQISVSAGYTTNADGVRVPAYELPFQASAQVQALNAKALQRKDGLNISGAEKQLYISGSLKGIARITQQGGDLIAFADGTTWLTTTVLERWPLWCKVAITLQNDKN